ncbi:unnamed protein product [Schistosoma mattheei]|uniref:Uncharacterized protein n=1 Tax=Schistosoma mattheei TaxID=31246 RepID=A0A3P8A9G6_9TREM|nr:unnamed protein product [Schistosoma mattheei]
MLEFLTGSWFVLSHRRLLLMVSGFLISSSAGSWFVLSHRRLLLMVSDQCPNFFFSWKLVCSLPQKAIADGIRSRACLVMQFDDLRNVCPIHFHRLLIISSSAGSCFVLSHRRLLLMVSGQYFFFSWKLVCSLPQKAVADGIRPMDVEHVA